MGSGAHAVGTGAVPEPGTPPKGGRGAPPPPRGAPAAGAGAQAGGAPAWAGGGGGGTFTPILPSTQPPPALVAAAMAAKQMAQAQAAQAQAAQTLVQLYAARAMSLPGGFGVNPYAALAWSSQLGGAAAGGGALAAQLGGNAPLAAGAAAAAPAPAKRGRGGKAPRAAGGKGARGAGRANGTSRYRGVSQHKLTGRWEASLWINKRQVYLGGFDSEAKAAHAHDLAALVAKGSKAKPNLPMESYAADLEELAGCQLEEVVARLRRGSSAFSRGKSRYRGVSGHKAATNFRRPWEARIGSFNGRKNVFLGLFRTEEEAAQQYDRALIITKGLSAKTNFGIATYRKAVLEDPQPAADKSLKSDDEATESEEDGDGSPEGRRAAKARRRPRAVPNLLGMLKEVFLAEAAKEAAPPAVPQ